MDLKAPTIGIPIHSRQGRRAPLLKNTRLPVDAITGNYDAFRNEGLSPDDAIAETLDCYPEAGADAIRAILRYRAEHRLQAQP